MHDDSVTRSSTADGTIRDIAHRPLQLRFYPDAVLREIAQPIARMDRHVSDLARDMVDLMHRHEGIGLAAPQVGLLVRLIVADIGEGLLGIVNPQVMPVTDVKDSMNEGCLSLPDVSVEIDRKQAVEVRGMDPTGGPLHFEARGLLARVIQHEVDHLEGILICDYATAPGERPQGITQRSRPAPMDKRA